MILTLILLYLVGVIGSGYYVWKIIDEEGCTRSGFIGYALGALCPVFNTVVAAFMGLFLIVCIADHLFKFDKEFIKPRYRRNNQ